MVLADLVPGHRVGRRDSNETRRVKGDVRMVRVIEHAIRDRQRPLRDDLVIPYGASNLRLRAKESARIVKDARRRYRRHNAACRFVETEVVAAMAATGRNPDVDLEALRDGLRDIPEFRAAITRMWPILTPAELLHDLFGSAALLRLAGEGLLTADERDALHRARSSSLGEVVWSESDVALLDEALAGLGPRPRKSGRINEADEVRSYGHIVIDEVQDLTPMQLRMVSRRSLNGSMTIVGDLAQATGAFAPNDWNEVLRYLPDKREPQVVGLSVGYRIPSQIMELADKVMKEAAPTLRAPTSVRDGEHPPKIIRSNSLLADVVSSTAEMVANVAGNVAVVCPDQMADAISAQLTAAGLAHGRAGATALDTSLTVVPVSVVKGLELDGVVVVEPAEIVASNQHGLRLLYVALTRSTQRLTVVHSADLPNSMR